MPHGKKTRGKVFVYSQGNEDVILSDKQIEIVRIVIRH